MICVSIGRTRHKMMLIEIEEAIKHGAELIELRLDFLTRALDLRRLLQIKAWPTAPTAATLSPPARTGASGSGTPPPANRSPCWNWTRRSAT
jgi:3-dehydroquinate dehydratase/shikimate dehydrogenase